MMYQMPQNARFQTIPKTTKSERSDGIIPGISPSGTPCAPETPIRKLQAKKNERCNARQCNALDGCRRSERVQMLINACTLRMQQKASECEETTLFRVLQLQKSVGVAKSWDEGRRKSALGPGERCGEDKALTILSQDQSRPRNKHPGAASLRPFTAPRYPRYLSGAASPDSNLCCLLFLDFVRVAGRWASGKARRLHFAVAAARYCLHLKKREKGVGFRSGLLFFESTTRRARTRGTRPRSTRSSSSWRSRRT